MRRSAGFFLMACLALNGASASEAAATTGVVALQQFRAVLASGQATAARWMRGPDSYLLQVVLERRRSNAIPDPGLEPADHAKEFIANTIRELRELEPWMPCSRPPSRYDPRETPDTSIKYMNQSFPPQFRERRLDVWLLKVDGTQVHPVTYSCATDIIVGHAEVTYKFPLTEAQQAAAVAVRIDENYYIEKLDRGSPVRR